MIRYFCDRCEKQCEQADELKDVRIAAYTRGSIEIATAEAAAVCDTCRIGLKGIIEGWPKRIVVT